MPTKPTLETLPEHPVTDEQVANAPCKTILVPTEAELPNLILEELYRPQKLKEAEFEKVRASQRLRNPWATMESWGRNFDFPDLKTPKILPRAYNPTHTDTVAGIRFLNEHPGLVATFREFAPSSINLDRLWRVNESCSDVMCAMKKIWGKIGLKLLYIKIRYGYNASEYAYKTAVRFDSDDLDNVILALEDLPDHLVPMFSNHQMTYSTRVERDNQGTQTLAYATIEFLGDWKLRTSLAKQNDAFHELSHNLSTKLGGLDTSKEWLKVAKPECAVSKYGQKNSVEDFAESLVAYRYSPSVFPAKCKAKYDYIKNKVFKGIEYTSVDKCTSYSWPNLDKGIPEYTYSRLKRAIPNYVQDITQKISRACKGFTIQGRTEKCVERITEIETSSMIRDLFRKNWHSAGVQRQLQQSYSKMFEASMGAEARNSLAPLTSRIRDELISKTMSLKPLKRETLMTMQTFCKASSHQIVNRLANSAEKNGGVYKLNILLPERKTPAVFAVSSIGYANNISCSLDTFQSYFDYGPERNFLHDECEKFLYRIQQNAGCKDLPERI